MTMTQLSGKRAVSRRGSDNSCHLKVADVLNMIEGVPVTTFAKELSEKWAKGEITGSKMKAALIAKHK